MHPILLILTLLIFSCEAEPDCSGTPGGGAVEDDCAQCTGGTTGLVANYLMDCSGDCGGDALEDDCGVCDGNNESKDECGICDGGGYFDQCNVCDADASNDCAQDCFGIWDGEGILDDCEVCDGGNVDKDECGVCFGTGSTDECGVCDEDPSNDCVQDCNEEWGGTAVIDDCEICTGGSTGIVFNDNLGCDDVCFTGAYIDICGVCSGGTTGHAHGSDDVGCGCFEAAAIEYWFDSDGDGLGAGDESNFHCLVDVPQNWVSNNSDEYPDCAENYYDCNSDCGGEAFVDDCEVCSGGLTDLVGNVDKDCNGDCFGDAIIDNCAVCSDGNSGHVFGSDDVGCGCFEPEALEYWYDSDSDGLGAGDESNFHCLVDAPEDWVSNNDDLEPDCETNNTDSCFLCEGDIVYCEDLTDFTLHLNSNGDLYYNSSLPIYGFQIDILSTDIDVILSDLAEESGLTMNMNSNDEFTRILVFSTDASSISDNCGSILNIQGSLEDLALTNLLFSTANGEPIPIVIYDCE
jgi:hypothetical protein